MISDLLPDIPRVYTAVAEWSACVVYILLIRKRLTSWRLATALIGGLGVLLGVQIVAGRLPLDLWTLGMAMAVAAMFGLIYLCARGSAKDVGYFVARAFVLAELVASFHWQLHNFFFPPGIDDSPVASVVLLVGVYGVAFAAAFIIERRHFSTTRSLDVDLRGLLSAVAIALITFFMSNLSFVSATTPFSGQGGMEIFIIRTLIDLAGYVALFAQQGQRLEARRIREVEAMDRMLRSQHEQYLASQRSIDSVNRKYHDLKHYLTALRAETDPDTRAAYLDQLEDSIKGHGARVETGNTVLDTILTAKTGFCTENDISLTCVVDGAALGFMSAIDLSALVGNALDNAIEAVINVPDSDRRLIQMAVFSQGSFVLLRFENYHEGHVAFDDDLPRSTKGDDRNHGYGIRNMRQIAESYGGTLTVQAEDDWFTLRVLIPAGESVAGDLG